VTSVNLWARGSSKRMWVENNFSLVGNLARWFTKCERGTGSERKETI